MVSRDPHADPVPALNEAIWTVDLSGISKAKMSFYHHEYNDIEHPFAGPFTDHYNADGVAISNDEIVIATSAPPDDDWYRSTPAGAAAGRQTVSEKLTWRYEFDQTSAGKRRAKTTATNPRAGLIHFR